MFVPGYRHLHQELLFPPKSPNKDHQNEGVKGGEGREAEQEDEGSGGERRMEGEV